uniref:U-box domain-containing protein n=1 Tax=Ascaris lumbricoides TaxID=6252 RepID=A0A0M3IBM5_ASCLU
MSFPHLISDKKEEKGADTGTRLQRAVFKRLPFTHCALSLLPFEDPVCTPDGIIFDLTYVFFCSG